MFWFGVDDANFLKKANWMEKIRLTKKALNNFITWSTSRYNNYCGLGSKKENVDIVFASLMNGYYTGWEGKKDESKTIFTIECAGGVGENGNGRNWRLRGRKRGTDYSWEINCVNGTITGLQSKQLIYFKNANRNKEHSHRSTCRVRCGIRWQGHSGEGETKRRNAAHHIN